MAMSVAPGVHLNAPDDTMEISSDHGGRGDDIDIDIDLTEQADFDEAMMEDGRYDATQEMNHDLHRDLDQDLPDTTNDEVMYEDFEGDGMVQESLMHDNIVNPDEHLTDVNELQHSDLTSPNAAEFISVATSADPAHAASIAQDLDIHEPANMSNSTNLAESSFEPSNHRVHDDSHTNEFYVSSYEEQTDVPQIPLQVDQEGDAGPEQDPAHVEHNVPKLAPEAPTHMETSSSVSADADTSSAAPERTTHEVANELPPATSPDSRPRESVLPAVAVNVTQEGNDALTSTQHAGDHEAVLHDPPMSKLPVIVVYEGSNLCLFPPMSHQDRLPETYLLQDAAVSDQSLGDLFRACRHVLGDTIGEENELTLEIEDLQMTISEVSTFFFA